jgi:hypothetical protein
MADRDINGEFHQIMDGQFLSTKERVQRAIHDEEVIDKVRRSYTHNLNGGVLIGDNYMAFCKLLMDKYGISDREDDGVNVFQSIWSVLQERNG